MKKAPGVLFCVLLCFLCRCGVCNAEEVLSPEEEQLWIKDDWYSGFGRQTEPEDVGFGHTPEQVAAFKSPDVETLLGYNRAVVERSKNFINNLSESELSRELNEPRFQPLPTVGVRIISILNDSIMHCGQAAYVRGQLQGRGWQRF